MSYFHMGRPHTIIGAERFHFRGRDGFGWGTLAIFTRHKTLSNSRPIHIGGTQQNNLSIIWSSLTAN